MFSREEVCEAISLMFQVARPDRGGHVAYTPAHVLEALRLLSETHIGRPQLARILGLGEASTKTLLARLESLGLVRRTGRGRVANERGARILSSIEKLFTILTVKENIFDNRESVILISQHLPPANDLTTVYKYRDYLVEHGCRTALIGGLRNSQPVFPGVPEHLIPPILRTTQLPFDSGLIIVVPAECYGALIVASIHLFKDFYCK